MTVGWLDRADRSSPWHELHVLVAGAGAAGFAAADALLDRGARVSVVDAGSGGAVGERASILDLLGAQVTLDGVPSAVPVDIDLVLASPGFRPDHPLMVSAVAAGVPVWGDVELAWRLRPLDRPARWLCLTGTNGKTTTVRMLESMLRAGGLHATAAGNVGLPLVDAVRAEQPYDVLAVELSSFQLHWTHSLRPHASAVLNVSADHLDWHGSMDDYARAKGRVFERTRIACVYNVADATTESLVRDAEVEEGCRAIGFTLGVPSIGMVGLVEDVLVDRAFVPDRATSAAELATVSDVHPYAPHNVANALAAAALARSVDVPPVSVRQGLRTFAPDPHRIATVAEVAGITYVDDSKATNPHAAAASLHAYDSVVWLAGGLAKGASFDELVVAASDRLRAVVVFGTDGPAVAAAVRRHAPQVRVLEAATVETGLVGQEAMDAVVLAASGAAVRGDTVLLAPACASMDQFLDYRDRGTRFAEAVARLAAR